jgi:hypothetical protein
VATVVTEATEDTVVMAATAISVKNHRPFVKS